MDKEKLLGVNKLILSLFKCVSYVISLSYSLLNGFELNAISQILILTSQCSFVKWYCIWLYCGNYLIYDWILIVCQSYVSCRTSGPSVIQIFLGPRWQRVSGCLLVCVSVCLYVYLSFLSFFSAFPFICVVNYVCGRFSTKFISFFLE